MTLDNVPADLAPLARRFAESPEFASSPLYRSLARVMARTPALLGLAGRGRPGQYPTVLFFGAVLALLNALSLACRTAAAT